MRRHLLLTLTLTLSSFTAPVQAVQELFPLSGSNVGSVTGGDFKTAHHLIEKKCISCHSAKRIEEALAAGMDMQKIQQRMEQKGVRLSSNEREVLGIFWQQTPLKKSAKGR